MSTFHNHIVRKLDDFDPILLSDLSRSRLMNRVDTKFVFNANYLVNILDQLTDFYSVLEVEKCRVSKYESLYLDGEDFPFYLSHHNKRDHRYKVRYRKYIDSGTVFLEVKEKRKGRTIKRRIEVDDFEHKLEGESRSFVSEIVNELPLHPCMHNFHSRITLVNNELGERVTIDLDLTYSWDGENKKFANLAIAELKQEEIDRSSPFYQLMKSHLIRPYPLSKYCAGMAELRADEGLKTNRFNKKLRTIKKINDAS